MSLFMSNTGDFIERIDMTGFLVIIWLSAAVPLPFLLIRLFARIKIFRKWFIDDYLVILAWLQLLAFSISWQIYSTDLYTISAVTSGNYESISDIFYSLPRYLIASVVTGLLSTCCLWSIKYAFLFFFRRLGENVKHQRVIWWLIVVWTTSCLVVSIGVITWKCIAVPAEVAITTCNSDSVAAFSEVSVKVQTAMDILADVSILIIPATLLWKSQIRLRKKMALGGIFSLQLFVMIAAIILAVGTTGANRNNDLTWMSAWAGIELGVAIIVACLASFRALFTDKARSLCGRPSYRAYKDPDYLERYGSSTPQKGQRRHTLYPIDMSFAETETNVETESSDQQEDLPSKKDHDLSIEKGNNDLSTTEEDDNDLSTEEEHDNLSAEKENDDVSAEKEDQLCELPNPRPAKAHIRRQPSVRDECVAQQRSWLIVD